MRRAPLILLLALLAFPLTATAGDALKIGTAVPAFELAGTDGRVHALKDFTQESKATVVVFTCNTCPFSIAYEPILIDMAKHYEGKGVQFVLINSNDPDVKPGDSFAAMLERSADKEYPFAYLYDATQEVAKSFDATVTPHVFLVDDKQQLRYRGRVNDNRDAEQAKSHDLMQAIDAILAGEDITVTDTKAFGCGIKWKRASS